MTRIFKRSTLFETAILLALASVLAFGANLFFGPIIFTPTEDSQSDDNQEFELIPVGIIEAEDLYDTGVVFIDVRSFEQYSQKRIKGAIHYKKLVIEQIDNEPGGAVIYDSEENLDLCLKTGQTLAKSGFEPVYILLEGFSGWLAAGLEVEGSDLK